MTNLWKPETFQGRLGKTKYFEGWYFKLVNKDETRALAVIPGISLTRKDSHAFIQVFDSFHLQAHYFRFPIRQFAAFKRPFRISLAGSEFSLSRLTLAIQNTSKINGSLEFGPMHSWPVKLFSPGAMGWYRFVPRMECYHGVLGFDHEIRGALTLGDETIDFTGGRGYIEKDWGVSMPAAWIWMQTNHFGPTGVSLFGSIAKIPWLGGFFTGFIFGLYCEPHIFRFTTYTGAWISGLQVTPELINVTIEDKYHRLDLAAERQSGVDLPAPREGEMSSKVNESLRSVIKVELAVKKTGQKLFTGSGRNAGLEFVGDTAVMLAGLRRRPRSHTDR